MSEIHIVRAVTSTGISHDFYFRKKKTAVEAYHTIEKRMKELEKKKEMPPAWMVEMEDDYGLRASLDLVNFVVLMLTNTASAMEANVAVTKANEAARDKHGVVQTGFRPNPELMMSGGAGRQ